MTVHSLQICGLQWQINHGKPDPGAANPKDLQTSQAYAARPNRVFLRDMGRKGSKWLGFAYKKCELIISDEFVCNT